MLYVRDYGWELAKSSNPAYLHFEALIVKNKRLNEMKKKKERKIYKKTLRQNRRSRGQLEEELVQKAINYYFFLP